MANNAFDFPATVAEATAQCFPRYALACLQLAADGYTVDDTATYVGCDVELVEDCLSSAGRVLGCYSIEQTVAAAMMLGLIA